MPEFTVTARPKNAPDTAKSSEYSVNGETITTQQEAEAHFTRTSGERLTVVPKVVAPPAAAPASAEVKK